MSVWACPRCHTLEHPGRRQCSCGEMTVRVEIGAAPTPMSDDAMRDCPHAETQYFGDGVYRCAECGDMTDLPKMAFAPATDTPAARDAIREERDRLRKTMQFIHDALGDVEATSAGAVLRTIEYASRHALAFPTAARDPEPR